jgi:amidase
MGQDRRQSGAVNETDLLRKSALEQGQMIRSGLLSSEELTELYLRRIAEKDEELHAFVHVMADQARHAARKADRARAPDHCPFYGVPIAIKDLNAVRGAFLRMGSRAFERFLAPADDRIVARLRRAGFIFVGKTATSEVGAMPVTEPDIHPPTRNPWDLNVTPGGSSGGAGAALAADLVPIAQGSDGGGSVRIPASFCGVVGFKPSRGVVENPFGLDQPDIVWTCGPLARSVDDAAALLDAMTDVPADGLGFLERSKRPLSPLRVNYATGVHIVETQDDVREAVERAAKILGDLGHHLEPQPALEGVSIDEFLPIWQELVANVPVADWTLTQPVTRWLREAGKHISRPSISATISSISDRVLALFGNADVWLTPTVAIAPPPIGAWRELSPPEVFARAAELGAFTAPFNVSGQPAISVPAGLSSKGHPIGVQIVGRRGEDATVLALGRVLEAALGWRGLAARRSS